MMWQTAKAKHEKAQNKALHKIKVEHTKAKQALLEKHEKAIQQATLDADAEADDETNQAVAKMRAEEAAVQQEMLDAEAKAKESESEATVQSEQTLKEQEAAAAAKLAAAEKDASEQIALAKQQASKTAQAAQAQATQSAQQVIDQAQTELQKQQQRQTAAENDADKSVESLEDDAQKAAALLVAKSKEESDQSSQVADEALHKSQGTHQTMSHTNQMVNKRWSDCQLHCVFSVPFVTNWTEDRIQHHTLCFHSHLPA